MDGTSVDPASQATESTTQALESTWGGGGKGGRRGEKVMREQGVVVVVRVR